MLLWMSNIEHRMMNDEGASTPTPVFSISMRFDFYRWVYFDIHYSIFSVHYSIVTQPEGPVPTARTTFKLSIELGIRVYSYLPVLFFLK